MTTKKRNMVIKELENLGYKTEITSINKNGISKDGIVINNNGINPIFYLENYDGTAKEIAKVISEQYETNYKSNIDVNDIMDLNNAKDNIIMCVRNACDDIAVTKQFCDLNIYFRVTINMDEYYNASTVVTKDLLDIWGITVDELFNIAVNNMKDKYMFQTTMETIGVDANSINCDEGMYVCTTKDKTYGASVMTDISILDKVAEILDDDLYILPSSIHEVILIRKSFGVSYQELANMIKEINEVEVSPEERLSDHPYLYNRKLKTIIY